MNFFYYENYNPLEHGISFIGICSMCRYMTQNEGVVFVKIVIICKRVVLN